MKELESILTDLTYVESMFGDSKNFHGTYTFDKQKSFTDIFLEAKNKEISNEQLELLKSYIENFVTKHEEIKNVFKRNLSGMENKMNEILSNILYEVIYIPNHNNRYNFVVIASSFHKFLFFKKNITFRIEYRNGVISSSKKTNNGLEEN
ncbi:hypothetical protein [Flavobacterium sp.]|uniref:hypothetical protein n=1 Tax=Flavobacterium sp. TaxID=239 RepID=UPI0008CA486B|nr:hypothetical protein [Flavobacterium sp.]OGS60249.1 MAG: hypothetical protein A2X07_03380 [Flavobacteria bacterium GWF1_32_7]HBD25554.1 hypothetical protein [Flavobacterium sp.]